MDDRINYMPDFILHQILSFLETREAAKTTLLSKRWRNLWVYSPALDFRDMAEYRVRRAILNHKTLNLRRLRITTQLHNDDHEGVVSSRQYGWGKNFLEEFMVSYIAGVEELCLRVDGFLFYCKLIQGIVSAGGSLRVLEISGCEITDAGHMKLTCVETLSLRNISVESDEALNNLISSCPNVRNIDLDLRGPRVTCIDLCLPQLEKMVISDCESLRKFTIDAPNLQHAELRSPGDGLIFSMGNSFDLRYARLRLQHWIHIDNMIIRNLICEFAVAKVLVLDCRRHLPLDLFAKSPVRCRVKKLEFNGKVSSALSVLKLFPCLEDFTFWCSKDDPPLIDENGELIDLQDVEVYCVKNSLKRITVTNFDTDSRGCDIQAEFMKKFLVEKALVLEVMYLRGWFGSMPDLLKVGSDLMTTKASSDAQIICT